MSTPSVYRHIKSNDVNVNPFKSYKNWTVTNADYSGSGYYWQVDRGQGNILWAGVNTNFSPSDATSFTSGGFTYFRGTQRSSGKDLFTYAIFRTSTTTVNINTGVPSPGSSISISQLFGARNP